MASCLFYQAAIVKIQSGPVIALLRRTTIRNMLTNVIVIYCRKDRRALTAISALVPIECTTYKDRTAGGILDYRLRPEVNIVRVVITIYEPRLVASEIDNLPT